MTDSMTEVARKVADGEITPTTALGTDPATQISAETAVRRLHGELPSLGVPSPFGEAMKKLSRVDRMVALAHQTDFEAVQRRRILAEQLAAGEVSLDEAVAGLDVRTVRAESAELGLGRTLAAEAASIAKASMAAELAPRAVGVFDNLANLAEQVVRTLQNLPTPPPNLWSSPDPTVLLAGSAGHELTLSTVADATSRFWRIQALVNMVRNTAGHGFERFPDGAPRSAAVYRNWRLVLDEEDGLRTVHRSMRLWKVTIDNWQPGVWKPSDIETKPADRSFGARLRNLGQAVTGG